MATEKQVLNILAVVDQETDMIKEISRLEREEKKEAAEHKRAQLKEWQRNYYGFSAGEPIPPGAMVKIIAFGIEYHQKGGVKR